MTTLDDYDLDVLTSVASVLLPGDDRCPAATALPDLRPSLQRAAAALEPELAQIIADIRELPAEVTFGALQDYAEQQPAGFDRVANLVSGAYFLSPDALAAIGYPTGLRRAASFDLAVEQIGSGVLDPVLERGPIYKPA